MRAISRSEEFPPARSAILTKNGKVLAEYNGIEGIGSGGSSSGGSSGGNNNTQGNITYTINSLPDWITNDCCVIYAWVWGGNYGNGKWISCNFTSKTSLNVLLDGSATGMLLARCAPNTLTPDWNIKTDGPGRVYNKTNNIEKGIKIWNGKPFTSTIKSSTFITNQFPARKNLVIFHVIFTRQQHKRITNFSIRVYCCIRPNL